MMIEFINADLEITSKVCLEALRDDFLAQKDDVSEFTEMACIPIEGGYFASFELHFHRVSDPTSAQLLDRFCDGIAKLPSESLATFREAERRVLDLGYESDDDCSAFNDLLPLQTLKRLVELDIEVAISIYPQNIVFDS